jgi:hypothetical protein
MEVTRIGLDIAKNLFQVHGVNHHGKTTKAKRVSVEINIDADPHGANTSFNRDAPQQASPAVGPR